MCILSFKNWKNKHTFLKTEKAKSSHFDRTRGYKNQIFPTLGYSFRVEWIPGKNHATADALTRSSLFAAPDRKEDIEDAAMAEISQIAAEDKDYQEVVTTLRSGPYNAKKIKNLHKSHPAQQYHSWWDSLAVEGVNLTYHGRMVVPEVARPRVLTNLQIQHSWTPDSSTFGQAWQTP